MDSIYDPVPTEGDEVPTKKVRHRKKQFLKTIRKQMEFYFSDANLSKNRFLGQLVSKDPQVDLNIFLSFNKIRDITTDLDDIKKALKKSEMLALTEDSTKVYRKTRILQNKNADESTIYVEQLPPDADHEWLKSVFLTYGDVPYVSIPKYPHNGLNKGFAFVEFDSPESATKALEAFGAMGCRLAAEIPPEQICSIKQTITCHREEIPDVVDATFKVPAEASVEQKSDTETKKLSKSKRRDSIEDGSNGQEMETKSKPVKKRKISFDDDHEPEKKSMHSEEGRLKKPKVKKEVVAEETESGKKNEKRAESAEKEVELCTIGTKVKVEVEDEDEGKIDENIKKEDSLKSPESESKLSKKRKLKKLHEEERESVENDPVEDGAKSSKKRKKEIKEEPEETDESLMETVSSDNKDSKDDEKENEGNDEVRKKKRSRNHKKKSKKEKPETEPKMNLRVLSKFEWKRLRNKYLDLQKVKMTQLKQHLYRSRWAGGSQDYHHHDNASQDDNRRQREDGGAEKTKAVKSEKKFTFTPGVIIHLRFPEPPDDLKQFKTDAKAHAEVKYVDAKEGCNEAYIRCSTAEAANQMLAQQTWSQMAILTDVEETVYWEKMNRDREVQCGRNERVKVRGKAKLLAKVEKAVGKHIRFTTEEESGPRG